MAFNFQQPLGMPVAQLTAGNGMMGWNQPTTAGSLGQSMATPVMQLPPPLPVGAGTGSTIAALPSAPGIFGLVVSGRPVTMDFRAAGPDKYLTEIPNPGTAGEVSVFLLPGVNLPADKGIAMYYSIPPFATWSPLGTLDPSRPSGVFRTGWPTIPEVASSPVVQIGLSIEPLTTIANVKQGQAIQEWDKLGFAQLVARDLFNYLGSFAQVISGVGERLVIPTNALDKWLSRFEDRYRRDPNFLYAKAQQNGGSL